MGTFEIANGVAVIIKGIQDTTRLKAAIPRDIRYVLFDDAKLVGDISWLFGHCYALRDVRGTVDMSGVTDMGRIFWQCRSLEHIDCADWDTSSVKFMDLMFYNCPAGEEALPILQSKRHA